MTETKRTPSYRVKFVSRDKSATLPILTFWPNEKFPDQLNGSWQAKDYTDKEGKTTPAVTSVVVTLSDGTTHNVFDYYMNIYTVTPYDANKNTRGNINTPTPTDDDFPWDANP